MFKWECTNFGWIDGVSDEKLQELLVIKSKILKLCDGLRVNEIMYLLGKFTLGDFLSTSKLDSGEVDKYMERFYKVGDDNGSKSE